MRSRFILIFVMLFFLINIISAEEVLNYSYNYDYDGTQITQLRYEPYPVSPGEYFDVWIKASLGNSVDYAKFELIDSFPFSVDENENPVREYKDVSSFEVVMHYKIRVSKDAVEGENELKLKYMNSKLNSGVISSFPIEVSNVQTDFDLVVQESSGTDVSIAIANTGVNTANSLIVRIPEQENYRISGTNGQMVGNLDSGDYTIVSFSLAQVGRGKGSDLQVQLDYTDSIGGRRSVVKNVQFVSASPINITGQVIGGNFQRGSFTTTQQSSSIFKSFWLVIIFIAGGGYWYHRKYHGKIKKLFFGLKLGLKKTEGEKNSKGVPDWVLAERTKRK